MGTFIHDVQFEGGGGSNMTPKIGHLGDRQIGHHLWMFPKTVGTLKKN